MPGLSRASLSLRPRYSEAHHRPQVIGSGTDASRIALLGLTGAVVDRTLRPVLHMFVSRWKCSLFGALHAREPYGVWPYTRTKALTSR